MDPEPQSLPTEIAVVHAFVNSLDLRSFRQHGTRHHGGDQIATLSGLVDWLRACDLLDDEVTASEADLRHAHELRAQLRACLSGQASNEMLPVHLDLQLGVAPGQPPSLVPVGSGVGAALAAIALSAVRAAATGSWHRLKVCAAPDCQWVFYDHSRPGRGRWCAPELCGNRMKTRAYRQRQH